MASYHKWLFQVVDSFGAMVFDFAAPFVPEEVEAEAVVLRIKFVEEALAEAGPLSIIEETFED